MTKSLLLEAKQRGFGDKVLAEIKGTKEEVIRQRRLKLGIRPVAKQIDTLAGEFEASTNYLYLTYHGNTNDIIPLGHKAAMVIGSGPYCIGSSVEFDWCAVNTVKALSDQGISNIMVNSNPETVSTDFDRSDRLYFEELTLERMRDIADFETPNGIVVSVGGQIANNLALPLMKANYTILGTSPLQIDRAEDRQKFSAMLTKLGIDQPEWQEITTAKKAKEFATKVGYPILVRPSYVLSGGAMNVVKNEEEMELYLEEAVRLSPDHPVVISRFISNAKEIEIDGAAKNGELQVYAVSEHIENAGVHSGDATVVFPAQHLNLETIREAKYITEEIIKNLNITGPFNIQFLSKGKELKVIECNVRASRSFPFVSKVSGYNFIKIAVESMLGVDSSKVRNTLDYKHVGVKSPQFSYNRLKGADPVAGVEMASTGEVAYIGDCLEEAFYASWLATDQQVTDKTLLLSLPDAQQGEFVTEVAALVAQKWKVYCTPETHLYMQTYGIETIHLHSAEQAITRNQVALMISVPSLKTDSSYKVRRLAIDNHLPLVTNAKIARLLLQCLGMKNLLPKKPKAWQDYSTSE